MSKYRFHFPLSVLTYNAGLLLDAVNDSTIGPPVLARIAEIGFLTRFSTLVPRPAPTPPPRPARSATPAPSPSSRTRPSPRCAASPPPPAAPPGSG